MENFSDWLKNLINFLLIVCIPIDIGLCVLGVITENWFLSVISLVALSGCLVSLATQSFLKGLKND